MQLSEHFSLEEFLRSETAKKYNIPNVATEEHIKRMKLLCINVLEPLRTLCKRPIIVTSGYRSNLLNVTMREHGYFTSETSQHCKGEAADIIVNGLESDDLKKLLLTNGIIFDQFIIETAERMVDGIKHFSAWSHISFTLDRKNRNRVIENA